MDPLQPGDPVRVGSYRLLGRLGSGGMGQVFLGVSPGGRKVAVKVIHPLHAGSAQFRERFAREIEAARRVGGFHTAPVVDADADADPPWMVTAFIDGPSLQDAVDQHGPLPPDEVRALGAGLAEGLAAIHKHGLVHRDLKPANVIQAPDGPRIIDFGIARVIDASSGPTAAGAVIGTFAYMSPEHLGSGAIGPASDVFSLGSVLAFAATGRPPFMGDSPAVVMYRLVTQPPELAGVADPELADLIDRCLAKMPEDRPTVSYLLAALGGPDPEPLLASVPDYVGGAPAVEAITTPPPPASLATGPERLAWNQPPLPPAPIITTPPGTGLVREAWNPLPLPPAPITTTPPANGPGREASAPLPMHRAPRPRARRWPAALIATVVLVITLGIALPFLLGGGTPPAAAGHRSGATDSASGAAASAAGALNSGGAGATSGSRQGPTAGRHSRTPQATTSSTGTVVSPAAQPASSPVSSSPATSRSPTSSKTTASSKSSQLVTIPNVTGLTANQAIQALQAAGFKVEVTNAGRYTYNNNSARVTSYSPTGQAPRGSTITIQV